MDPKAASAYSSVPLVNKPPTPSHRHAAPSAPWPFVDIDDDVDPNRMEDPDSHLVLTAVACDHKQTPGQEVCWCKYPQALYPNWTPRQQKKAKLSSILDKRVALSAVHCLDVYQDGSFVNAGKSDVNQRTVDSFWRTLQQGRPSDVHLRALFVDGLSANVMQILGTRYNLEPFFFSSAVGWIPSRHQTNVVPHESDHITITLTFVRSMSGPTGGMPEPSNSQSDTVIDTLVPLTLRSSGIVLLSDQLAVHMVRSRASNTIISLHPKTQMHGVSAQTLHSRVHAAGRSVYWNSIFKNTMDATFVLLSLLWYALYAWDEALEHLYSHVCFLESQVISTSDIKLSRELHVIRAHLLHYETLLKDFTKTIDFVCSTPNPSLEPTSEDDAKMEDMRRRSQAMLERECGNMLTEIARLERSRNMQDARVKNVMDLSFSMANIEDSKGVQLLTEASMKDSAAIKQISYLTMAFAPAGFVAGVFGMNVTALNPGSYGTLAKYIATAVPLTVLTIWVIVAFQIQIPDPHADKVVKAQRSEGSLDEGNLLDQRQTAAGFKRLDLWERIWWPIVLLSTFMERRRLRNEMLSRTSQRRILTD
ncbi:hypothetical protein HYPSUDRAFT_46166 [Hypholoma sublateritium FD-334 SS-4]|uniref:Uncharacterized protein n=1 Tax=Hypholoma sublateritium (strain FD-334 SS-4) TaxID=945553 RepID=A0A0D2KSU0_HYPSF|nr:hypothetical protein HYPSUDRAFT_46166 [Hypholoma sublateritium FD-334 SS-4]